MKNFGRLKTREFSGFSLIEMVLALSLVALIVGIGAISYALGRDERVLRESATKIEAMSSRGHALAVLHQKPFWLRIEENRLVLAGPDTNPEPAFDDGDFSLELEEEEEQREVVYEEYSFPTKILFRRWGAPADDWQQPQNGERLFWHFQSTGLCEPVSFRIEMEESWIVMHMHPLTARVEEEETHIQ